ncbi:MAG: hypothetical protein E7643_04285 [Ruminococcaceae bacterium]|nr:hypothetical protein [Oscillospiraceae bacterium]
MDYIVKDALTGELIPVLLGVSAEVNETAHRMYREYGVVSHVFCERIPLSMRLSLCMKFHLIKHTRGERLMIDALTDFANQLGNADVILYLIPCTEEYANLVWEKQEALEGRYVIASRNEFYRVWFGEEAPTPRIKEDGHDY